jgi:hypothetical protein
MLATILPFVYILRSNVYQCVKVLTQAEFGFFDPVGQICEI